jgi:hypothetical protein
MRSPVTILLCLCATGLSWAVRQASFESVETENGRIIGHRSPKAQGVWE